jgi:hypothetical protein
LERLTVPRFTIRTLMVAVAVAGLISAVAAYVAALDTIDRVIIAADIAILVLPALYIGACVVALVRGRGA